MLVCVISVGKNAPEKLSLIDLGRLVLYIKNKKYTFVPLKPAIMFNDTLSKIIKVLIIILLSIYVLSFVGGFLISLYRDFC